MQSVEFIGPIEPTEPYLPPANLDPAEAVTDPEEIFGIIRRAVTVSWKNQAFTYDELANRLAINAVPLPDSAPEREAIFDTALHQIWQEEREIARLALRRQPIRLRFLHRDTNVTYHGIVTPGGEETSDALSVSPAQEETKIPEAIAILNEHRPALTPIEIAGEIFEKCTASPVFDTVIDIKKFINMILAKSPATDSRIIQNTISELQANGYIEWHDTSTKKHPRGSMIMSQGVKQEVLSDIAEGGFDEALHAMFASLNPEPASVKTIA